MELEDTYNIHKKINCIFPFFKSKLLCIKGIHNFRITPIPVKPKPTVYTDTMGKKEIVYITGRKVALKCYCCGKIEDWEEV